MTANMTQAYKTINPRPKTWQVIKSGEYEQITSRWQQTAKNENKPFFMLEGYHEELAAAVKATFETRKAARAYIESIGGAWK